MIIQIEGAVIQHKVGNDNAFMDIMTSSGVGYRVIVPTNHPMTVKGAEILLHTSFQVRDDSQDLYGFSSEADRDFFDVLISVSGIGAKTGISVLSLYGVEKAKEMILAGDHVSLSKVKGLGPKGAKKIILELAGILSTTENDNKEAREGELIRELREALRALGFKGDDINGLIERGKELVEVENDISIEILLQRVLRGN